MRKSDFLDQLRLEVGLAYDYAVDKEDFFKKVLNKLYEMVNKRCNITVYIPLEDGNLSRRYVLGKAEEFGVGFTGLCTLNTSVLLNKNNEQAIISPIFENGSLTYVICINIITESYRLSKQDMEFVNELVRFIGAKCATFPNSELEE
ncbi:hypothetical protein J2S74_001246 [Evansella vedderi]|uniref:Uncharacterized protein n=1 Tax=Evansella vedderi TaxID=38282 RepID=A0ABT9ZRL5_9BACI|nr:hypothetical protein [Evansella vedderi]MDQ0253874.1 hypothetical protein [Evansella vedderi]